MKDHKNETGWWQFVGKISITALSSAGLLIQIPPATLPLQLLTSVRGRWYNDGNFKPCRAYKDYEYAVPVRANLLQAPIQR